MKTDTKKLFFKISLFLPILLLIVATNYYIDPAGIFRSEEYELGIAQILSEGKHVTNVSNYNERLVQKFYIDRLDEKKDVIVLGSSRAMQIRGNLFKGKSFFNNGVSGSSLEDHIAIYGLYRSKQYTPSVVIFALDPWIFNKNAGQDRWQSIKVSYFNTMKLIFKSRFQYKYRLEHFLPAQYLELFKFSYFNSALKALKNNGWKISLKKERAVDYVSTKNRFNEMRTVLADGSWVSTQYDRNKSLQEVRAEAHSYVSANNVYSLENFIQLDSKIKDHFKSFVSLLRDDGCTVVFFLAPYHPHVYKVLTASPKYKIINEVEAYLKDFANKHHIQVLGTYSPMKLGLTEEGFFDGMHAKEESINKIFTGTSLILP